MQEKKFVGVEKDPTEGREAVFLEVGLGIVCFLGFRCPAKGPRIGSGNLFFVVKAGFPDDSFGEALG